MRERIGTSWATMLASVAVLATALPVVGSPPHLQSSPARAGGSAATPRAYSGGPGGSPSAELSRVQQQLAWRRKRLAEAVRQERWVLSQLSGAQERLERAIVHLNQTTTALAGARRAVQSATRSLDAVTARLTVRERLMGARVRAFYERGPVGYLDMLLDATDFRDFLTRSYLVGRVVERDLALYNEVATERQRREDVQASLVVQREQLSEEREQWATRREETVRLADERRRLLDRIRIERQAQEAAIRELEAESARITEIIRQSARGGQRGPILRLRPGALLWPVSGPITSGYGWRTHPIFRTREFHTGIDIAAPYGTAVVAAHDGTIIFNGWMRGYGMLVIVDHGGGLTTTYSHLSASLARVGDRVTRGMVIARIGSTGWSTGPHLFFEVREDGRPVNPLGE